MEDFPKWLQWVWAPFVLLGIWFVNRLFRDDEKIWIAFQKADAELETRLMQRMAAIEASHAQSLRATHEAISALHEKANQIRDELRRHQTEAEKRYVNQSDLVKSEQVVEKAIHGLTVAIADLRQHIG